MTSYFKKRMCVELIRRRHSQKKNVMRGGETPNNLALRYLNYRSGCLKELSIY